MFTALDLTLFTIGVYGIAAVAGLIGLLSRRSRWRKTGAFLSLGAFLCQTLALIAGFHGTLANGLTVGAYLQLFAWFALLCGLCAWWLLRNNALILFATQLGLIIFLMSLPSLQMAIAIPPALSTSFYILHVGALFLSLGLLALAFIAGIIFLVLRHRLKTKKKLGGFLNDMPALSLLDKINATCALSAFPLYTLGVVTGFFRVLPTYGQNALIDPKELSSLFIWLLLAILFHNRLAKNWKGKKPAILAILIFSLSLFSLLVVNFFTNTHHGFIR